MCMWQIHLDLIWFDLMPWVMCVGLPMLARCIQKYSLTSHTMYKPITIGASQPCWRSAGCAGFCFSPAITHLIQLIIPNELKIKCAIAGLEQKSAHQVDQWSVEQGWPPLVRSVLFTWNYALVIITYLLLLNYLLLFRLRCPIFTYELAYLYIL
jgi:hypothetical protein